MKLKEIPAYLGLMAAAATLLSFILTFVLDGGRGESSQVVLAQILSTDELTELPPLVSLNGQFEFEGQEVEHLWKVRSRFINAGSTTLVGSGLQSQILGDALTFEFQEGIRILNLEEEQVSQDLNVSISSTGNSFELAFGQWREGESLVAAFSVDSLEVLQFSPSFEASGRPINDGELRVEQEELCFLRIEKASLF